jgi:hypothetical protein
MGYIDTVGEAVIDVCRDGSGGGKEPTVEAGREDWAAEFGLTIAVCRCGGGGVMEDGPTLTGGLMAWLGCIGWDSPSK